MTEPSNRERRNGLPYYKAYPRDFIEGTVGMPFDLKGAYRLLLDLIYMQNGRLQDDSRYISGLLGCSVRRWKSLRKTLITMGKIRAENGIISNFRADKELEISANRQDKNAENRAGFNKINDLQKRSFDHTDTESDTEPDIGQSTGSNIEANPSPKENSVDDDPADAGSSSGKYFFEAGIIRLNRKDYDEWEKAFPLLALRSELFSLADWAGKQKNWFCAVSGALAKRHRDLSTKIAMAKAGAGSGQRRHPGIDPRL